MEPAGASTAPKLFVTALHTLAVAVALAFLSRGVEDWFGGALPVADPLRRWLVGILAVLYLLRLVFTEFVIVERPLDWSDALSVGPWVVFLQLTMAYFGGTTEAPVDWVVWAGVLLYVTGSWLGTWSDLQRRRFQHDPRHAGELYTGGLFSIVMHPNYLGETVLFAGFACVAGGWWPLLAAAAVGVSLAFGTIPHVDARLEDRYGDRFRAYAWRTKRLVPFLW
ncbi:methyltransferase family protein [Demequina soli]|uniref:methyltransferase family protein n=1 Tax=Demequina soli TaxID=1638987 RepID=UPI0007831104|nr:isoprenylcysteine carboxylmethyltransferase family protein [Demequina soli]